MRPQEVSAPASAYSIFMKSLKDDQEFQNQLTDKRNFLKAASAKWREMTDDDKVKYNR